MGTTFSVNEAILLIPPINMHPANIVTIIPVIHTGILNAVLNESEIEFA